jgi:dTDP-4-dehydrorhamnose 3,5-epimerase
MWSTEKIVETAIQECKHVYQDTNGDERGWFSRLFEVFEDGLFPMNSIKHVNNSLATKAGTLRGLHWQEGIHAETKIVRCTQGSVMDIVVDVRRDSPTFGESAVIQLEANTPSFVYVPRGCAHGIISLTDRAEIIYWSDQEYVPKAERGMRFDDPFAHLSLPSIPSHVSEKDLAWPRFGIQPVGGVIGLSGSRKI